ncbi:9781_t:CDS:1 [Entrophospora sp. SA101]|nr:9781_t:CDS:1 [Entrophospora sp. SA101]
MKIPARSDQQLLDGYSTYKECFQAKFPLQYENAIRSLHFSFITEKQQLSEAYRTILNLIKNEISSENLSDLVYSQLLSLEKNVPWSSLMFEPEQYQNIDM